MNSLTLAYRVLTQLRHDTRFLMLSLGAPIIVVYFLKIFLDTLPPTFPTTGFIMPLAAFVVYFFSLLMCAMVLVQERMQGTLERMIINGVRTYQLIAGYTLGYLILSTGLSAVVLAEVMYLFSLSYSIGTIAAFFGVMWILSIGSVLLGIFISTFARREAHVFPFIPLVTLPSIFLSGLLMDVSLLPTWAQWVARGLPLYYVNRIFQKLITEEAVWRDIAGDVAALSIFACVVLVLALYTFKETE